MTQKQWYNNMIVISKNYQTMLGRLDWTPDNWNEVQRVYLNFINEIDELTKVYELEKMENTYVKE